MMNYSQKHCRPIFAFTTVLVMMACLSCGDSGCGEIDTSQLVFEAPRYYSYSHHLVVRGETRDGSGNLVHNVHERLLYDANCFQFSDQTRKETPPGKFLIYTRADERACQWKSLRLVFYEYDKGDCGDVTLIPLNSIHATADTVEVIAFIGDSSSACVIDSVHVSVHPGRKKGDWPGGAAQPGT